MHNNITCVILAGGLSRRMGHIDKAFIGLDNKPLLAHVLGQMQPQTAITIINANGDPERFSQWGLPVVADTVEDFPGPLAGVLAAMEWNRKHQPQNRWIISVPVDSPFVPGDLVTRLLVSVEQNRADMACAKSNNRHHPVIGLWPVALADNLRQSITCESIRKVDLWTSRFNLVHTEFDTTNGDPFFNINRPQDVEQAEQILRGNI